MLRLAPMLLCAVLNASVGTALRILIETGLASFYSALAKKKGWRVDLGLADIATWSPQIANGNQAGAANA